MSDAFNTPDLFSELDRLQRQMSSLFGGFPTSLRSTRVGTFPQINVGSTEDSVEIVAFAPGLDVMWRDNPDERRATIKLRMSRQK